MIITEPKFELVATTTEMNQFKKLWQEICIEKNVSFHDKQIDSFKYLFKDGVYLTPFATVEFTKYTHENSFLEDYFSFYQNEKVKRIVGSNIYTIGKLSIKKDCRGAGLLDSIVDCIFQFALEHEVDYFLSAINYELFRILRFQYHFKMDELGPKLNIGPRGTLPIMADAKWFIDHYSKMTKKAVVV